jgi:hypothetical protein
MNPKNRTSDHNGIDDAEKAAPLPLLAKIAPQLAPALGDGVRENPGLGGESLVVAISVTVSY